MIRNADAKDLVGHPAAPGSPVLGVYLDVDQSKAVNLRRGFEASLKQMVRALREQQSEDRQHHFVKDAERVERFVAACDPNGKGLVIFCDDSEDFFWWRVLQVNVHSTAKWTETPYISPLISLMDEYERYGVALVDHVHARLCTVFMGEIEEHSDLFAPAEVRHIKTTGTDHLLSQKQLQRKAEMHALWHLKNVAEALDKLADRYGFDRLLLAGPVEATSELYHLLPKRLRTRVVSRITLPIDASASLMLERTLTIERQVEREMEKQLVEDLLSKDTHHPVTRGLDHTLRALHEERIWRLLYATGLHASGGQCSNCRTLTAKSSGPCDYCVAPVKQVDELMELVVERVVATDGKVEEVAGEASTLLRQGAEGIGAVLRFQMAPGLSVALSICRRTFADVRRKVPTILQRAGIPGCAAWHTRCTTEPGWRPFPSTRGSGPEYNYHERIHMATQEAKTTEQQGQSGQRGQSQPQQGRQEQNASRENQQDAMTRRRGYDPFGSLIPAEMFPFGPLSLLSPFSVLRRLTEDYGQAGSGREGRSDVVLVPPIEVSERDGNLVIEAELPGQNPEDVKVEVTNDAVIVEAERTMEREENRGGVYRTERRYGRFYRSIPLPEGANVDQAQARFENGVLEVRIPVTKQQTSHRQLQIQSNSSAPAAGSGQGSTTQS